MTEKIILIYKTLKVHTTNGKVVNQYELVIDKLPKTIQELKDGLAKNK